VTLLVMCVYCCLHARNVMWSQYKKCCRRCSPLPCSVLSMAGPCWTKISDKRGMKVIKRMTSTYIVKLRLSIVYVVVVVFCRQMGTMCLPWGCHSGCPALRDMARALELRSADENTPLKTMRARNRPHDAVLRGNGMVLVII
jgi:hypothetical protein